MKALSKSCSARKFETTVEVIVDGKMRSSKVTLCGKVGQTDADWANTLKDAVKKVESNETMAQAAKDQIIAAFNAEIAKIEPANAVASAPPVATTPPAASPEYATIPPLPPASTVATKSPLPTASVGSKETATHYPMHNASRAGRRKFVPLHEEKYAADDPR